MIYIWSRFIKEKVVAGASKYNLEIHKQYLVIVGGVSCASHVKVPRIGRCIPQDSPCEWVYGPGILSTRRKMRLRRCSPCFRRLPSQFKISLHWGCTLFPTSLQYLNQLGQNSTQETNPSQGRSCSHVHNGLTDRICWDTRNLPQCMLTFKVLTLNNLWSFLYELLSLFVQ